MANSLFKYKEVNFDKNGSLEKQSMDYVVNPIQTSHFYLPTRDTLNDPTEGVFRNVLGAELNSFLQGVYGFGERNDLMEQVLNTTKGITQSLDTSGIFSLTTNHTDEIMWAHYAGSHTGIAIEYDLDLLTRFVPKGHLHIFDVIYDVKPPKLGMHNISSRNAMQVMFGYKSPRWNYEEESRVVLDNFHGQIPHDYRTVKSITFGYRFPKENRAHFIELVKDRVKDFYEILKDEGSYKFKRVPYEQLPHSNPESKVVDIDWEYHLSGLHLDEKRELIKYIEQKLKLDPHYSSLLIAEKSTDKPGEIAVTYELSHAMGIHLSKQYHKFMV
ncbi:MAG: DUF2971 domain-containing protein [Saccharospirillaceae bacterium]|nr:DUF2971 domain-containing protein [Saccharospirillaceae bacterium]